MLFSLDGYLSRVVVKQGRRIVLRGLYLLPDNNVRHKAVDPLGYTSETYAGNSNKKSI